MSACVWHCTSQRCLAGQFQSVGSAGAQAEQEVALALELQMGEDNPPA